MLFVAKFCDCDGVLAVGWVCTEDPLPFRKLRDEELAASPSLRPAVSRFLLFSRVIDRFYDAAPEVEA